MHPLEKYALALIESEHLSKPGCPDFITCIKSELNRGLSHFRMKPVESFQGKSTVKFGFFNIKEGKPNEGIFLSPNILTPDKNASYIHGLLNEFIAKSSSDFQKNMEINTSIAPTAGEYLTFGKNSTGRRKPTYTTLRAALLLIATTTPFKPSLAYKKLAKKKIERINTAVFPDLEIEELKDFIGYFKKILVSRLDAEIMLGSVYRELDKNGKVKVEKPLRPKIYDGNFPNAPISSALGSIGLLAAIGEWAKISEDYEKMRKILESLKDTTMYMISYGNAQTFTYNHHIIDLAKNQLLNSIVNSAFYVRLTNNDRSLTKEYYEKFYLFFCRFLVLFSPGSFNDFLSFRAEYPENFYILLKTYFEKMAQIQPEIVSSAKAFGKWLNRIAYQAAKLTVEVTPSNKGYWSKINSEKNRVLIELESSTFSARSGDALIAQAITRAGRLSGSDAPEEASLFIEKTCSGELPLENAKNLLIAFSRLVNKLERKENPLTSEVNEQENEDEDYISDAQH